MLLLISGLTKSIQNLEASAKARYPQQQKQLLLLKTYADQLNKAAVQLASLNEFYAAQVQSAGSHGAYNDQVAENAERLKAQMEALSDNLATLNQVYGGMLSAMNKN